MKSAPASRVGRIRDYAKRNVLGVTAIVIATSGTAVAASALPGHRDPSGLPFQSVQSGDLAPGSVTSGKLATDAVRGRSVKEKSLDANVLQRRVTGVCATGQTLEQINRDGSVLCQVLTGATGAAGGDLTGTYPNPDIAAGAVGSPEIANGGVASADLGDGSVGGRAVSDGSLTGADVAGNSLTGSQIDESTLAAGGDLTGTVANAQIGAGTVGPSELSALPAGRAVQTTLQSFPSGGGPTRVHLESAQFAQGVTFDNTNDQFVITTPGIYLVSAEVLWISDKNGLRFMGIYSSNSPGELVVNTEPAVDGYATLMNASTVQRFSAGDTVHIEAATSSASTTDTASSGRGATLSLSYLGPISGANLTTGPSTAGPRHLN